MQLSNAKSILLSENTEWSRLMAEESQKQQYIRYGIALIIASHLAATIGWMFTLGFGWFFSYGLSRIIFSEVLQTIFHIAYLFVLPQVLASTATMFDGEKNELNALKLYVFSLTPLWIGSLAMIVPFIGWLGVLGGGLYSLYLLWKHVGEAMHIAEEKKVVYVLVNVVIIAVAFGIVNLLISNMIVLPVGHRMF